MTTKKSQSQNAGSATIDNIAISNRDDPSRIAVIAGGFIYWLPIQLGIPISAEGFYDRMWFTRWI